MVLATLLRIYRNPHQSRTYHELRIQKLIVSVGALQEALPSLRHVIVKYRATNLSVCVVQNVIHSIAILAIVNELI